jgi:hypothetical protein
MNSNELEDHLARDHGQAQPESLEDSPEDSPEDSR